MSSAWYVGWPYQPCTYTVTDVVEAPVVNDTLSCWKPLVPGVQVLVSVVPVPLTPMYTYEPSTQPDSVYV